MAIPAALNQKIEGFLAKRSKSDGGYAPVGDEDIAMLGSIVQGLIKAKYQKDPDGDLPVAFELVDRTRFETAHFQPVPHLRDRQSDCVDMETMTRNMRIASGNLSTAQGQVERAMRQLEFGLVDSMRKGLPVAFGARNYEVSSPLDDRSTVVDAAKTHTTEHLDANPPLDVDDFNAREKWEKNASQVVSDKLGAPVQIKVYRSNREEGKLRVALNMIFMGSEQANSRATLVIDDPAPAFRAREENAALETKTATPKADGRGPKKRL